MEAFFAIVHDKDAGAGVADERSGVFVHIALEPCPFVFVHGLSVPVVADYRLRILGEAFGFEHELMSGILGFEDQTLDSVEFPRSVRQRDVVGVTGFPFPAPVIAFCDMAGVAHHRVDFFGNVCPRREESMFFIFDHLCSVGDTVGDGRRGIAVADEEVEADIIAGDGRKLHSGLEVFCVLDVEFTEIAAEEGVVPSSELEVQKVFAAEGVVFF